mgnify:CR=1 FL=1
MAQRYGIAEIYGNSFADLCPAEIRRLSAAQHGTEQCPFKGGKCTKSGGVCSLRLYADKGSRGAVPIGDHIVTTCPNRFHDGHAAFGWVGETLLGTQRPGILTELPFLLSGKEQHTARAVGKIDMVLVDSESTSDIEWCALEMQAVYFSGASMSTELKELRKWQDFGLPYPRGIRRPDFRSSGPKRLMPQLQIKVPTLSRWGKKMAVIVDRAFWNSLASMSQVKTRVGKPGCN